MKKTLVLTFAVLCVMLTSCGPTQKEKNQEAIEARITSYMKTPENMLDVSNYEGLEYSPIDTLPGYHQSSDKAFRLILLYQGLNTAGRQVKREADVFFNKGFEVTLVKTTKYLNPMTKEEYKSLGKEGK